MNLRIVGVDEVGRGCLAGPLVVCAFSAWHIGTKELFEGTPYLKDSKSLTPRQRRLSYEFFKANPDRFQFYTSWLAAEEIDDIGIYRANLDGVRDAVRGLHRCYPYERQSVEVIVDGDMPVGGLIHYAGRVRSEVRADSFIAQVMAASIVAKYVRDTYMEEIASTLTEYAFDKHKGYGTPAHLAALKKHGPSPIHRLSFEPMYSQSGGPLRDKF